MALMHNPEQRIALERSVALIAICMFLNFLRDIPPRSTNERDLRCPPPAPCNVALRAALAQNARHRTLVTIASATRPTRLRQFEAYLRPGFDGLLRTSLSSYYQCRGCASYFAMADDNRIPQATTQDSRCRDSSMWTRRTWSRHRQRRPRFARFR